MEKRITELEIKLTIQQDTIDELSDLIRKQHDEIDRLTKAFKVLQSRLQGEDIRENEPPPHY